ncbi:Hypothetical predicted protein [Pelobates cultripes]|uniref:Uncharacterized protein n=1 Tax=Pelobates cultripes TaxID=61616 RepID=A0AAD1RBC4_PELCU|nr:Hypothetical predicted protein [Pelobates cultripes]
MLMYNTVDLTPENYLLHLTPLPLATYKKTITPYLINAARSLIPAFWKKTATPSMTDWIMRIEDMRTIEELILIARGQTQRYQKIWLHWLQWLTNRQP